MSLKPVTSREYKFTLNVNDKLYQDWKTFKFDHILRMIEWTCNQTNIGMLGNFGLYEQFTVNYMDTPKQDLYKNGWIFRVRKYKDPTPNYEYTLKFRSPDRYYSAAQILNVNHMNRSKINVKFEEDITLDPFNSNFSPSINLYSENILKFKNFKKLTQTFNKLNNVNVDPETPIVNVGGKKVIQEVWKSVFLTLGDTIVNLKIVLWWGNPRKRKEDLVFGEIMFRLRNKKEKYSKNSIVDAHKFYNMLNKIGLTTGWISSNGLTKTEYFYKH